MISTLVTFLSFTSSLVSSPYLTFKNNINNLKLNFPIVNMQGLLTEEEAKQQWLRTNANTNTNTDKNYNNNYYATKENSYKNTIPTVSKSVKPVKPNVPPVLVQGGSLRTWSYNSPSVEQVQLYLSTEGRPLDTDIELWHGPNNTPTKMRIYVEDGKLRPCNFVLETPRGPNTVAVRNIAQVEFPISAIVSSENVDKPSNECISSALTIQGGALRTYPFDQSIDSVQIYLTTDGRPLNARIELLQGPNSNKQIIELYTEDGCDRPFFFIVETPGSGNVVRVVNTAPVEFPMTASVLPFSTNTHTYSDQAVMGGDINW